MIETLYTFSTEDATSVERIVEQPDVRINHLSLAKGESVDPHPTPDAAHFIITKGVLGLKLDNQEQKKYSAGTITAIPAKTMHNMTNLGEETMHLFVIKTV